ncbi:MAG: S8 family peptidase [Cyclobacteriaceae bacterium]|nr:S8 family peptidase [Cyclobacteriaceae bacterium HetDA_MAG_MS6]
MGLYKVNLSFLIILLSLTSLTGQVNRYMVFFTDKNGSNYTIENPEQFLSARAIERRSNQAIAITEEDLPVVQSYLDGLTTAGADVYFTSKWFNAALIQADQGLATSLQTLEYVSTVEYIAAGARLSRDQSPYTIPDTFNSPSSEPTSSVETQLKMIGANVMHEDGYRGEGMIIAVLDGGFPNVHVDEPFKHLFTEGQLVASKDFVANSGNPFQYSDHGTAVLSLITGQYGLFQGTAPEADIVLCVTEDTQSEFRIEEYNWVIAAEYADSLGADIITASVGYTTFNDPSMNYDFEDLDGMTAVVTRGAAIASTKGILVVTSAGNSGLSSKKYVSSPADGEQVIAVGSVTKSYQRAGHSSVGPTPDGRIKPDVMALGSQVDIFRNGNFSNAAGTSMAAPMIAGLAAGIWQANPDWSNTDLINALRASGSRFSSPDSLLGYGVASYRRITGRILSVDDIIENRVKVYPNPFYGDKVFVQFHNGAMKFPVRIELFDTRGVLIQSHRIDEKPVDNLMQLHMNVNRRGVYFLRISSNEIVKQVKLIKK